MSGLYVHQNLPATPEAWSEQVVLANRLFQEFYGQCFWHSPRNLNISEEMIPFVVKGLRVHGGQEGFYWSQKLRTRAVEPCPADESHSNASRLVGCL